MGAKGARENLRFPVSVSTHVCLGLAKCLGRRPKEDARHKSKPRSAGEAGPRATRKSTKRLQQSTGQQEDRTAGRWLRIYPLTNFRGPSDPPFPSYRPRQPLEPAVTLLNRLPTNPLHPLFPGCLPQWQLWPTVATPNCHVNPLQPPSQAPPTPRSGPLLPVHLHKGIKEHKKRSNEGSMQGRVGTHSCQMGGAGQTCRIACEACWRPLIVGCQWGGGVARCRCELWHHRPTLTHGAPFGTFRDDRATAQRAPSEVQRPAESIQEKKKREPTAPPPPPPPQPKHVRTHRGSE